MSTSLTSSRLTIGSYYADEIAGRSNPSIDYSTLATTRWVNTNYGGSSSGGADNAYNSLCDVGGIAVFTPGGRSSSGSYAGFYALYGGYREIFDNQASGTVSIPDETGGSDPSSLSGGGLLQSILTSIRRLHNGLQS